MKIQFKIDVGILIINTSRCVIIIIRMCTPERGDSDAQKGTQKMLQRHPKKATATPKRGNSDAQKNAMAWRPYICTIIMTHLDVLIISMPTSILNCIFITSPLNLYFEIFHLQNLVF
jgi:hypothetical protein